MFSLKELNFFSHNDILKIIGHLEDETTLTRNNHPLLVSKLCK
jgi:hypothetical protein